MEQLRDYSVRLQEFCEKHNYTLIADEHDYIILDDINGIRHFASGEALHWTMLSEGIK